MDKMEREAMSGAIYSLSLIRSSGDIHVFVLVVGVIYLRRFAPSLKISLSIRAAWKRIQLRCIVLCPVSTTNHTDFVQISNGNRYESVAWPWVW
jgi:hypothetical protein